MENELDIDYERDVEPDIEALDVEWARHSDVVRRYSKHAAYMSALAKKAEERVKTLRSEFINDANEDPEGTIGKAKPNAQDIEAYYRTRPKYKDAKEAAIEAEYEAEYAQAVAREMAWGRKASLEGLVRLAEMGWFAGPKVPRSLAKLKEKAEERRPVANKAVAKEMRRKKK
jgi:hypothetical protein